MISPDKAKKTKAANFRFSQINGKYLLTNDSGDWIFMNEKDFSDYVEGKISSKHVLYKDLVAKGFIIKKKDDLADYILRYKKLNSSVFQGPSLFIFVTTLQCNHRCLYCQVTPEKEGAKNFDMTKEIAKRSVDLAFRTPSPFVGIEFQGGEPLLNWPIIQYVIKYAKALNKVEKKELKFDLVTNLTLMTEEKLRYLIRENVSISCSFDGPAEVHDKNRIYVGKKSGSHKAVAKNIRMVQKYIAGLRKKGKKVDDFNGILTTTKFSLPHAKAIVDEYRSYGFNNLFIRPLSPFGFQRKTLDIIGYSAEDFIKFYIKVLDYIMELNKSGEKFVERNAYFALKKILKNEDPGFYEMRSPCGAGIGQMAFNYDGRVYTCDEGRMAERMGIDNFQLGTVSESEYKEIIDNEVTKTMCLASTLDNHAACADCVYKPYCGICPLANFIEHGTIFPQIPNTDRHKINKALFEYLFSKIENPVYREIFESWMR